MSLYDWQLLNYVYYEVSRRCKCNNGCIPLFVITISTSNFRLKSNSLAIISFRIGCFQYCSICLCNEVLCIVDRLQSESIVTQLW